MFDSRLKNSSKIYFIFVALNSLYKIEILSTTKVHTTFVFFVSSLGETEQNLLY